VNKQDGGMGIRAGVFDYDVSPEVQLQLFVLGTWHLSGVRN